MAAAAAFVQSLSCVRLFASPWTAARQALLSFTISWSLLKFMSIESVMLSNHQWRMAVILDNAVVGKILWHIGSWLRAHPGNHHLPHWELDNDPVSIEMAKTLVPVGAWAPFIPNPWPLWTGSLFTTFFSGSVNLAKLQDTKSIHRNHLHFYILAVKSQKEKLRNQSHSPLQQKV